MLNRRRRLTLSSLILVVAVVAACAAPPSRRLELPEGSVLTGEIRVRSTIVQEEVFVSSTEVQPAVFVGTNAGLLTSAIENLVVDYVNRKRSREAEALVEPLRDVIPDLDVRSMLWTDLELALRDARQLDLFKFEKRVSARKQPEASDARLRSYLDLNSLYFLSEDASTLHIKTDVRFLEKRGRAPLYFAIFSYRCSVADATGSEAIDRWALDSGRAFRRAIIQGIGQTVDMLLADLRLPPRSHESAVDANKAVRMRRDEDDNPVSMCDEQRP